MKKKKFKDKRSSLKIIGNVFHLKFGFKRRRNFITDKEGYKNYKGTTKEDFEKLDY